MPADFVCEFSAYNDKLIHQRTIQCQTGEMRIEVGCALHLDGHAQRDQMKRQVWEAIQHASAGNHHLIQHLSRDRHSGKRPISRPQIEI